MNAAFVQWVVPLLTTIAIGACAWVGRLILARLDGVEKAIIDLRLGAARSESHDDEIRRLRDQMHDLRNTLSGIVTKADFAYRYAVDRRRKARESGEIE